MEKPKKKKKTVYTVLMLICILIFLFALYKVVSILIDYKKVDDVYDGALTKFVEMDASGKIDYVDLAKMMAANEDIKGWIYIEGTDISYPVLQGPTNQYYLFKDYKKDYLVAGSIFLDSKNSGDFSDDHTIIYGHNMHNGSMFGPLDKFFKQEYMEEHQHIYLLTKEGKWNKYKIFGAYTAGIEDGTFDIFTGSTNLYENYLQLIAQKNVFSGTEAPANGEKILTLSTCTEDSDDYKRNVLQAKLIGASDKID